MKDPYGLAASGVPPEILMKMQGGGKEEILRALMAQGMSPLSPPQTKGRFQTASHPLSAVAKIMQAYMGSKGLEKAQEGKIKAYADWKSTNEAQQMKIAEAIANFQGPQGTPAVPAVPAVQGRDAVAMSLNPQSQQGFQPEGQLGLRGELPPVNAAPQPRQTSPTGGPIGLNGPDGPFPIVSNDPVARDIEAAANFQPSNEEMDFYNTQMAPQPVPVQQQGLSAPDLGVTPSQPGVEAQPAIPAQEAVPAPLPTVGSVMQKAIAIAKREGSSLQKVLQNPQILAEFEQAKEIQKVRELSEGQIVSSPEAGEVARGLPKSFAAPKQGGWKMVDKRTGNMIGSNPEFIQVYQRTNPDGTLEEMPVPDAKPGPKTNLVNVTQNTGLQKPKVGYQWNADGTEQEIIRGGPVWDKQKKGYSEDSQFVEYLDSKSNDVVSVVDKLIGPEGVDKRHPGMYWGTGLTGVVTRNIPGTDAKDFDAMLGTLKAKIGFSALSEMRRAAPTGGALGNVSDREVSFLQNSMRPLEAAQSEEALVEALREIRANFQSSAGRVRNELDSAYEDLIKAGGVGGAPTYSTPKGEWKVIR